MLQSHHWFKILVKEALSKILKANGNSEREHEGVCRWSLKPQCPSRREDPPPACLRPPSRPSPAAARAERFRLSLPPSSPLTSSFSVGSQPRLWQTERISFRFCFRYFIWKWARRMKVQEQGSQVPSLRVCACERACVCWVCVQGLSHSRECRGWTLLADLGSKHSRASFHC